MSVNEEQILELLVNNIADESVNSWAKRHQGKVVDQAALVNLRYEFAKALVAVAGGVALAFTGIASEAGAARLGQKVQ